MEVVGDMIDHENAELRDRVSALERKVQLQEDEILCLKSALADCLRRLNSIDSGRSIQNNLLPSKPSLRTPARKSHSGGAGSTRDTHHGRTDSPANTGSSLSPAAPRHTSMSSAEGSRASRGSGSTGTSPNLKKWGSVPGTNVTDSASPRRSGSMNSLSMDRKTASASSTRSKEHSFNPEDGTMRFFMRGRPLTFHAPSNFSDYEISAIAELPEEQLKLEWVYGYRGRDARCNIYLLPTGEVVYFVASVVVLYNIEEQMQRHYLGHTDDVKCIAVHPDRITIATGQVAGHEKREGKPHIRIWDSVSLNTLKIIGIGEFERAVACVGFSKTDGGQYVIAVDESNEHIVSLWDWQKGDKGYKVTETKSSTEPVLVAEFHPCEKNCFVTCGKSQLSFWCIEGGTLTRKQGLFEKHAKPKFVTCLTFVENGDLLTGDSNGNLFMWPRGTNKIAVAATEAHDGGIFSICVMKDGSIITGGRDRRIVEWNPDYTKTGNEHELPEQYGAIRMLTQGKGNIVIAGTTRNCILQGTLDLKFSAVVQGHMDELWGLSTHPNQHQFVTCGYDKNLYLWDTLSHSAIWCMELPDGAHCACFHPGGHVVAVGSVNARWYVVDIETRDILASNSDGNEAIECVQYSPDGGMLAVGSRDNYIYVYTVSEDGQKYSKVGRCSGHSSFVTHLDWSADGQYLQSNSGDYEHLYCIWPEGADGTDVNACSRSANQRVISSADDFGKVNLYKYPCCQPKSEGHTYGGHSSHVTNVKFIFDDTRLLSTGGKDTAVLQWELLD